jgi:hypothetical protein
LVTGEAGSLADLADFTDFDRVRAMRSVLALFGQVITVAEKVTALPSAAAYGARRHGDPPTLVADSAQAKKVLGWMQNLPNSI